MTHDAISRNAGIIVDACEALPGFQPTLVGGDGNAIQNCEFILLELMLTGLIMPS